MAARALYMKLKMWRVRSGATQTCATAAWTFIYDYGQKGAHENANVELVPKKTPIVPVEREV